MVSAYASEDSQAGSDTLRVSSHNPCLNCHNPSNTHQRWTTNTQLTFGHQIGAGANPGVDLADSSKVSGSLNGSIGVGLNVTVTENSKAGTPAMPIINVDTTGTHVDTTR